MLLLMAALAAQAAPVAAQSPWPEIARRDLAAIRDTILVNHPGPVDLLNPEFGDWLGEGYARATELADSARSLEDALIAVRFFVAGFADVHTTINLRYAPLFLQWPGSWSDGWTARRWCTSGRRVGPRRCRPWARDSFPATECPSIL
jgi:hypothetical protein